MKTEREIFEDWCTKDDEFGIHRYSGSDDYSDDYTQSAWLAWQASVSREGYKLVPVEPTEKMMHSALMTVIHKNGDVKALYKAMIGTVE